MSKAYQLSTDRKFSLKGNNFIFVFAHLIKENQENKCDSFYGYRS